MTKPRINKPSKEQLETFLRTPVKDTEMSPDVQKKIDKLMQFFDLYGIKYDKFQPKQLSVFDQDKFKQAYPNNDVYQHIPAPHNISKWMETVRQIYKKEQGGELRSQAIKQLTASWKEMETYDFLNWLRYYEGSNQLKYKMAQQWYEGGAPGYFLPIKSDAPKEEPQLSQQDIDFAKQQAIEDQEKQRQIERARNKIVGRLDSAEKLLRSPEGKAFSGEEFGALMEALYQLKQKIHMVNKLSTATKLYEDLIVRQSNILARDGFVKAAEWLYGQAQANNPPPTGMGVKGPIKEIPNPAQADNPIAPLFPGAPGGLPSLGPGMPQNAPASTGTPLAGPNDSEPTNLNGVSPVPSPDATKQPPSPTEFQSPAINEFLSNLNGKTDQSAADTLEVEDDLLEVEAGFGDLLVSEGQVAINPDNPNTPDLEETPLTSDVAPVELNPGPPAPKVEVPVEKSDEPATEEPLEVTEDDIAEPLDSPLPEANEFDAQVDQVFANATIEQAISKLEDLAKMYNTREIPRQFAVVDMILDSLGLVSFLPSLGEIQAKSLESNNYINTRIEDIVSKLRGATEDKNPTEKLKNDQNKEKARKQQRKEMADAEPISTGKEKPNVEIAEDLAPPIPQKPPTPVA